MKHRAGTDNWKCWTSNYVYIIQYICNFYHGYDNLIQGINCLQVYICFIPSCFEIGGYDFSKVAKSNSPLQNNGL